MKTVGAEDLLIRGAGAPPGVRVLLFGLVAVTVGAVGFVGWAAHAPLSSAAVARGAIVVDGNRKVVQHIEGGSIAELLVREGDKVRAGQLLMRLDDLEARALHDVLQAQYIALTAQEVRLRAEREGRAALTFPVALKGLRHRPEVAEVLEREMRAFDSGRKALQGQIDVLQHRVSQLESQIVAFQAQTAAGQEQIAFLQEETADVAQLLAKGLERKPRVLALRRALAGLQGQQGEFAGRIAEAGEAIAETQFQILSVTLQRVERAALELSEVSMRRAETEERLSEARVKLGRREVTAPVDGTVFDLRYHTVGGVVQPGTEILQVVPTTDALVAEVQVSPNDIDVVRAGLDARVVLSAYKRRNTPQMQGSILQVSADAMQDESGERTYFVARIGIEASELEKLDDVHLSPGMPVEVFIQVAERSMLDYLIQPVTDSLRRAFREN